MQRDSQYEGDLEAKFYYAARKLIWEVVDSAELKSKIEIKWSDISAIRATFQENGLDILEVEVRHQFFLNSFLVSTSYMFVCFLSFGHC